MTIRLIARFHFLISFGIWYIVSAKLLAMICKRFTLFLGMVIVHVLKQFNTYSDGCSDGSLCIHIHL